MRKQAYRITLLILFSILVSGCISFPSLVINTARRGDTIHICVNTDSKSGQLWKSEYLSEKKILLSDDSGGFYDPVWSPDRNWIAYILIEAKEGDYLERIESPVMFREYSRSDSVWIMSGDGSEKFRLSEKVTRVEGLGVTNSGTWCWAGDGIFSIVGWSYGGEWVAYQQTENKNYVLHIVNIENMESLKHTKGNGWVGFWSPVDNKIVIMSSRENEFEVITVDTEEGVITRAFQIPREFQEHTLELRGWRGDGEGLLFRFFDSGSDPLISLWEFDIGKETWEEIGFFNDGQVGIAGNYILVCHNLPFKEVEGMEILRFGNGISKPIGVDCTTAKAVEDNFGRPYISFFSRKKGLKIWVYRVKNGELKELAAEFEIEFDELIEVIKADW